MNREPIYAALFALVSGTAPFVTTSRRLKHWADVQPEARPALFQAQIGETARTVRGTPTIWTFQVDIYVYWTIPDDAAPGPIINPVLDAISTLLRPPGTIGNVQTLGGLVDKAYVDGKIQTDEGTLGDTAVAIIPVLIVVPD